MKSVTVKFVGQNLFENTFLCHAGVIVIFLFRVSPPQSSSSSFHLQFKINLSLIRKAEKQERSFWRKGVDRIQTVSQTSLRLSLFVSESYSGFVWSPCLRNCGQAPTVQLKAHIPVCSSLSLFVSVSLSAGQHASDTATDGSELQQLQ